MWCSHREVQCDVLHVVLGFSLCSGMGRLSHLTELQFHCYFWAAGGKRGWRGTALLRIQTLTSRSFCCCIVQFFKTSLLHSFQKYNDANSPLAHQEPCLFVSQQGVRILLLLTCTNCVYFSLEEPRNYEIGLNILIAMMAVRSVSELIYKTLVCSNFPLSRPQDV
jgi:hypothetical protein